MTRINLVIVEDARRRAAALAQDVLDGNLPLLAAAPDITRLLHTGELSEDDKDLRAFVVIDSETDALPVTPQARALWDADVLREKEKEIEKAELWAREFGLQACRNLVSRFATA